LDGILALIEGSAVAGALRTSGVAYPLVSGLHVLGISLLIGSAVAFDLRAAGLWRATEWRRAVSMLAPVAAVGLGLAMVSGALLFSVRASVYASNPAMLTKWGLIAFGGSNAVVFHGLLTRHAGKEAAPPVAIRVAALLSLGIWVGALLAGHWIAFTE
jgi:hypothetical protein